MTASHIHRPYSFSQRKSYVHYANVLSNKWFRSGNEGTSSLSKEFEVNSLELQRGGTTKCSKKGFYDYQNPP